MHVITSLLNSLTLYMHENLRFLSCGTIYVSFSSQVTWHNEKRPITRLNCVREISITRGGTWGQLIRRRFNLKMIKSKSLI